MNNKLKFILVWILFYLAGPTIVLLNTDFLIVGTNKALLVNLFQRILGMSAFGAITFQIVLGGNMDWFREKFGSWALSMHKLNGLFAYTLIFLHPVSWIFRNYFMIGTINPYYPFVDVCVLCKGPGEYFYNFGRLAFWSITFAVLAARLVTIINNKWLRYNWRKIHILNYFAFYFVSIHSFFIGTDSVSKLFIVFFVLNQFLVATIIVRRLRNLELIKLFEKIQGL